MKKYISLIGAIALGTTSSLTVIACGTDNNDTTTPTPINPISNITNETLYKLISNGEAKAKISNFLNQIKIATPETTSSTTKLLKNLVIGTDWNNPDPNAFSKNIINPLTSFSNYLVAGLWSTDETTPANASAFKDFMANWKDSEGHHYSQWYDDDKNDWQLGSTFYKDWNPNDFNFYRSGVLINYLFYKIGKDYQISKPTISEPEPSDLQINEYKDRYLGDIIADHLDGLSMNQEELMADLGQYLPHLLENPSYIMTLIEALVPVIKQWIIQWDATNPTKENDITQGLKYLTIGKKYPTNSDSNSYNVLDILNNLNYWLNNTGSADDNGPGTLYYVISKLLGLGQDAPGKTFAFDIKIKALGFDVPLASAINLVDEATISSLINTLTDVINTDEVKNTFTNVLNMYQQWSSQYDNKNDGITLDLTKLQDFLLNTNNGLVPAINNAINSDSVGSLFNIFTNQEAMNDQQYFSFYETLGGILPDANGDITKEFKANSVLAMLKNGALDTTSPLGQIALILLGNGDYKGLLSYILQPTEFFNIATNLVPTTNIKNDWYL